MSKAPTREEMLALYEDLRARGLELDERQARVIASLDTVEESIGQRALAQLDADRDQHRLDLLEWAATMERIDAE